MARSARLSGLIRRYGVPLGGLWALGARCLRVILDVLTFRSKKHRARAWNRGLQAVFLSKKLSSKLETSRYFGLANEYQCP